MWKLPGIGWLVSLVSKRGDPKNRGNGTLWRTTREPLKCVLVQRVSKIRNTGDRTDDTLISLDFHCHADAYAGCTFAARCWSNGHTYNGALVHMQHWFRPRPKVRARVGPRWWKRTGRDPKPGLRAWHADIETGRTAYSRGNMGKLLGPRGDLSKSPMRFCCRSMVWCSWFFYSWKTCMVFFSV